MANQYTESKRYHKEPVLNQLYIEEGLSTYDIAEKFGVSPSTICKWLDRNGIGRGEHSQAIRSSFDNNEPYKDKEVLKDLYIGGGLSVRDIADKFGVTKSAILMWLGRHDIERRGNIEWNRTTHPGFYTMKSGYEVARAWNSQEQSGDSVLIHRLSAVAWFGWDAMRNKHVHHESKIPWDNREDNIKPIDPGSHSSLHHERGDMYELQEEDRPYQFQQKG